MRFKSLIMDEKDMERALTRIAHEIIEANKGLENLIVIGIRRRGVPMAERLIAKLKEFGGCEVPGGTLDITHYRDDLSMISDFPEHKGTELFCDINDKTVVLTDDVLFTGRTARCAIEAIFDYGRPRSIQLAVMVDRGHRELPIRPDYVGKNIPTSRSELVSLKYRETDGEDVVNLMQLDEDEIKRSRRRFSAAAFADAADKNDGEAADATNTAVTDDRAVTHSDNTDTEGL